MKYYLYWIHRECHTSMLTEGYVGVTGTPEVRFKSHQLDARKKNCWHIHYAINKYNDLKFDVICIGDVDYILELERKLRSKVGIGWNTVIGGRKPLLGIKRPKIIFQKIAEKRTPFSRFDYIKIFISYYIKGVSAPKLALKYNCEKSAIRRIVIGQVASYPELNDLREKIKKLQKHSGSQGAKITEFCYNQIMDDRERGMTFKFIGSKYQINYTTVHTTCNAKVKYIKEFKKRRVNNQ